MVYNEEARLEECLSDARPHVDEIVVVDQMSTDATPEIAQRLADVYIRDVHHGHAEPSRELAASRSSGDWILILDADERMTDLLKTELPSLVAGDRDGYWINKANLVDGVETSTVMHFRLVRKSRARFDPGPHGGARTVTGNVENFERIGILHEKSVAEQVFDDARYEQLALEDDAPTSSKRNWLAHNRTLREQRERRRRSDLEALLPAGVSRVLVLGDIRVELPGGTLVPLEAEEFHRTARGAMTARSDDDAFDGAIVALPGQDPLASVGAVAAVIRPGGVLVGTVPAARNRRRLEGAIAALLSVDPDPASRAADQGPAVGTTRRDLLAALAAAGLDVRWLALVRDGWLNPVGLQPDGSQTVVESDDFLLKRVPAEVAEELTAEEIVFAAVSPVGTGGPDADDRAECSVIVAVSPGAGPAPIAAALAHRAAPGRYELVVVGSDTERPPIEGSIAVPIGDDAGLAARWNAGARAAGGTLLAFLSTNAMPSPAWLDTVLRAHRSQSRVGAVGSKVVGRDGTVEHAGLVLGPDRIPYRIYQGESATAPEVNRHRIVPAVSADGMVISRARFVAAGGFDETLRGEDLADADLCLRLRSRGFPIIYAPAAELLSSPHTGPGSGGGFRRSAREFAARWSGGAFRSDEPICAADGRDPNQQWVRAWRLPRTSGLLVSGLPAVAWTSHFFEQGGYTEEAMAAVEALDDAGVRVVANAMHWDRRGPAMPADKAKRLAELMERELPEDFIHVAHMGANRFKRHPAAMRNIGRTMFETDGLPAEWRDQCNAMDEIWVPSEHNLHSFAAAGVAASKLYKVPETFDTELFDPSVAPLPVEGLAGFVFLSLFSWTDRKAWDVLLRAWFEEFGAQDDVTLLLKTDTANAPAGTNCAREVAAFVRGQLQRDPRKGPRVVVLERHLETADVPRLYRAADAFVLASHGEGWGRPYMEAMAMGLPTIATRWSGNLEFMNDDNSYLVGYELGDTPADSWRHGQRWAHPSVRDLRRAMRRVYQHRHEAVATGMRARADVLVSCRPELLSEVVRERLEAADQHPIHVSVPDLAPAAAAMSGSGMRRPARDGRRLTACVVARRGEPSVAQCLASLRHVADVVVVVEFGGDSDGAAADEDMASVRNEALDQATGGWILMLDATQTLDPASVGVVRELVDRDQFAGYAARELHQFGLDGAVSGIEERSAVLFPRHPDLRYVGRVAEQLLPQRPALEFPLGPSRVVLHQHDYRPSRYDPVAQARRHLPLLERSVREAPHEPFHLYNLGAALNRLGLHDEAEAVLRQAIGAAPRRAMWRPPALTALSRAVGAQGRPDEAVKWCQAATKRAPGWAPGWSALGAALGEAGRPKAAVRAYLRALDCSPDPWPGSSSPDDTAWQVRAGIGRIHLAWEEYGAAANWLGGAVAQNPGNAELRVWLARAYEGLGQSAEGLRQFERAMTMVRAGPEAYLGFSDFFTRKAEAALVRGLADNAESRALLERIERLRAAGATG